MRRNGSIAGLVLAGAMWVVSGPVMAQTADNPAVLNTPGIQFWNVYGAQASKPHKDKDVQGGMALRVAITKTVNVWDVGASVPITGGYKAGDHIVVGIYARLVSDDAAASIDIPATVQTATTPYTGIIQGRIHLTTAWQLLPVSGVANADYAENTTNLALSLGGEAKTIELGPVFVLNQGQ